MKPGIDNQVKAVRLYIRALANMEKKYPDKYLRIVSYPLLAFVLRHFGEYESIGQLMKKPLYYADLGWNLLIVAVSWELNRQLILWLDRRYSWISQTFQRFTLQTVLSMLVTVPVVATMIYLWNEVIIHRPGNFDTSYLMVYDFPLTIVFTLIVHMIYTGMYFRAYYTTTIEQLQRRISELETSVAGVRSSDELSESSFRKIVVLNYGTSSVPVKTADIAYIYKQNEISFIKTFDGKEYTSSSSLDSLEALFNPADFYRINRQMIGNIRSIKQFKSDGSGRLILDLVPAFNEEVAVSKKRANSFREWLGTAD